MKSKNTSTYFDDKIVLNESQTKITKPLFGCVMNFPEMMIKLKDIQILEKITTRSLTNNIIEINCHIPDSYRKLVRYIKDNNIVHHTFHLKEDSSIRVARKYLHHSIIVFEIKEEINKLGHK